MESSAPASNEIQQLDTDYSLHYQERGALLGPHHKR